MEYRIQHESINLTEEKKIIREIKQLENTRDKVIANAAVRAEIQKSVGEKDSLQDQVKVRTLLPTAYIRCIISYYHYCHQGSYVKVILILISL